MAEDFIPELLKSVIALFIIVDPLGNIPNIIGLTEMMGAEERRNALRMATLVAFVLLIVFTITGQQLLIMFGVSLYSFMIAGGVLLLLLAIKILVFGGWSEREISPTSVGAVPIACPLLIGPGAITTTIVILQTAGIAITMASVLIIFGIILIVMRLIEPIYKFLGKTGSVVIARIMAIFKRSD